MNLLRNLLTLQRRSPRRGGTSCPLSAPIAGVCLVLLLVFFAGCATVQDDPEINAPAASGASANDGGGASDVDAGTPVERFALDDALPQDPTVRKGLLDNGLTYYIRANAEPAARAELRLVLKAGSILETDAQQGLAHFVEHMAFNGTERYEKLELIDFLESIGMRFGADVNAYTSFDETVYMLQAPTDDPALLNGAIGVLAEWAGRVTFAADEVERERGVVIEEWRSGRGAGARIRDQQLPVLFAGSRYPERLPIGKKEVLETFPRAELISFYEDWYRPDLMAVIVVGDVDVDAVESAVISEFEDLAGPADPPERPHYTVPINDGTDVSVVTDPELSSTSFSILFKQPAGSQHLHGDYRRSLVGRLFDGMLNLRLSELAQQADPPFIGAGSSRGSLGPNLETYSLGAAVSDDGWQRGLRAVLAEAERVRRHGFTAAELERVVADHRRAIERAYEERETTASAAYAAEYTRNFLEGESFPGIAYELDITRHFLSTISLEELNALAERFLATDGRVLLATGPQKEGASLPTEEAFESAWSELADLQLDAYDDRTSDAPLLAREPEPGTIVEREYDERLGLHDWKLSNGIRVLLKPTDFKADQLLFTSWSPGGSSLVDDADWVAALTATSVLGLGGLGEHDLIQLQKKLAGTAANVSAFLAETSEGLTGGGSPDDLETMFQLFYLTATAPRADPAAFESYRSRMLAVLENQRRRPDVHFSEALSKVLSRGHVRRRPFDEELLAEADLDRSLAVFEDRFSDLGDLTLLVVGSLEPEQIAPFLERYVASLPSGGRTEERRDLGVRTPEESSALTVRKGLEQKSQVALIYLSPFEDSRIERYRLQSMAEVLRTRLRKELREELGGTYGVSVSASSSRWPIGEATVSVLFGCDPERVEDLVAAVEREISRLREELADADEIASIQEIQRRQHETSIETNSFWLGGLRYALENDEDPHEILTYPDRVASLDAESVRRLARRHLGAERRVRVTLLPEESGSSDSETLPPGR